MEALIAKLSIIERERERESLLREEAETTRTTMVESYEEWELFWVFYFHFLQLNLPKRNLERAGVII